MRRVLLTGLPRSGTTMCCSILNAVPDVLALVEPWPVNQLAGSRTELVALVEAALQHTSGVARNGWAQTKSVDREIAQNIVQPKGKVGLNRRVIASRARLRISPLKRQGTLVVKHNAFFAALLPDLARYFTVYGVVRNPVSVLCSWRSVNLPVRSGRLPAGERIDTGLERRLDRCATPAARQRLIVNWFFERLSTLPDDRIIRYEEVVQGTSRALRRVGAASGGRRRRDLNRDYPLALRKEATRELLTHGGAFEAFYPRDELLNISI